MVILDGPEKEVVAEEVGSRADVDDEASAMSTSAVISIGDDVGSEMERGSEVGATVSAATDVVACVISAPNGAVSAARVD